MRTRALGESTPTGKRSVSGVSFQTLPVYFKNPVQGRRRDPDPSTTLYPVLRPVRRLIGKYSEMNKLKENLFYTLITEGNSYY